jgi:hypothetical protein
VYLETTFFGKEITLAKGIIAKALKVDVILQHAFLGDLVYYYQSSASDRLRTGVYSNEESKTSCCCRQLAALQCALSP